MVRLTRIRDGDDITMMRTSMSMIKKRTGMNMAMSRMTRRREDGICSVGMI